MWAVPLADEAATVALGAALAGLARSGDVFALDGDLGAGKTTLARAFVRALTRPDEDVPSPTFTLVQTYDGAAGPIWHFDLYRIERDVELLELDIEDAFATGISLVEWPARLGAWMPPVRLDVRLDVAVDGGRRATLAGTGGWPARLRAVLGEEMDEGVDG